MIRKWLADCLQEHDWCNTKQAGSAPYVPDRLLHVTSGPSVRLSTDHSPSISYLALSYCWGTPKIFSTTRGNIKDHLQSIPWSMLPKTFQHAVEITRSLGYDYIWIDSLCIIQQDAEDFADQSIQMGDIYANALAVISADIAHNVHEGIHRQRQWPTTIISIPNSKGTLSERSRKTDDVRSVDSELYESSHDLATNLDTIYANAHLECHPKYDHKHHEFESSPIKDRAWVGIAIFEVFK
jgi:hypothetical protein